MCGITGFSGKPDQRQLEEMTQAVLHRGPDDAGFYSDDRMSLGMRRLSIIDLDGGHQPIHNEDHTLWLVFNGEIFNFRELRDGLIKKGHRFYTQTDGEVLVHLYEEYGADCVHHLRGMFAFALWDKEKEQLFIARDRLGIKPLYYMVTDGVFCFASEMKSLLSVRGFQKQVDPKALLAFLTFLYIPSPLAVFKGIEKLPPGHRLVFKKGRVSVERYWDLEFPQRSGALTEEEYCASVRGAMRESVQSHLVSDVPLGVFLSGGLDSSAIVAFMADQAGGRTKTFSIGYGEESGSYDELEYARRIAGHFGTDHHEFILKPNIVDVLPKLVWHLDEPFADSSLIPTYLVSQSAREHVTVALTGIGGDELFGGYPRYLGARLGVAYEKMPQWVRKSLANVVGALPESTESRNLAGWAKRFTRGGLLTDRDRYLSWVSFMNESSLRGLLSGDLREALGRTDVWRRHRDLYDHNSAGDLMDRILYLDTKTYLADDLLMMGDKMSMAGSLELRVPYCDHRLFELSAGIPSAVKYSGNRLKSLFKKSVADLLPEDIIKRKKQGFMVPVARWFQKELKDFTLDLLSRENIQKRGLLNPDFVHWMLDQHYTGRQNLTDQIFSLLTLELWHRIYMDGERY